MNLIRLISNLLKSKSSTAGAILYDEDVQKQNWEIRQNDLGVFTYNSSGFEIDLKNEYHYIKWADIERLVAYKADLMSVDEICMDIIYDNKTVIITEETFGWHQFIKRIKTALLSVNENWEALVLKSPFEYDLTTIYERFDRKMGSSQIIGW